MNRVHTQQKPGESHADKLKFSLRDVVLFIAGVTAIVGTIAGAWWRLETRVTSMEIGHAFRLAEIEKDVSEIRRVVVGPDLDERVGFKPSSKRADP